MDNENYLPQMDVLALLLYAIFDTFGLNDSEIKSFERYWTLKYWQLFKILYYLQRKSFLKQIVAIVVTLNNISINYNWQWINAIILPPMKSFDCK